MKSENTTLHTDNCYDNAHIVICNTNDVSCVQFSGYISSTISRWNISAVLVMPITTIVCSQQRTLSIGLVYHDKTPRLELYSIGWLWQYQNLIIYIYIYIYMHTHIYLNICVCKCMCICVCVFNVYLLYKSCEHVDSSW